MSLIVTLDPEKTVNNILSNVDAAESQLPYSFQRQDYEIEQILLNDVNNPGFARVLLADALGDLTAEFTPGQTVYVFDPNGATTGYTGTWTITDVSWNTSETVLGINAVYTINSTATNGYLNNISARTNYRVGVELLKPDGTPLIDLTFFHKVSPSGLLFLDVGELLTEYHEGNLLVSVEYYLLAEEKYEGSPAYSVDKTYTADATASQTDTEFIPIFNQTGFGTNAVVGGSYYLLFPGGAVGGYADGYYEVIRIDDPDTVAFKKEFIGSSVPWSTTIEATTVTTPVIQSIYASKQLLDVGGSNMWDYLLNQGGTNIPNIDFQGVSEFTPSEQIEIDPTDVDFTRADNVVIEGTLSPVIGTRTKTLLFHNLPDGYALLNTTANGGITFSWDVTNFLVAGTFRVDFVGLPRSGGAVIWGNMALQVSADSVSNDVEYNMPDNVLAESADFYAVGWRPSMNGDYTVHFKIDITRASNRLEWISHPEAKLLTRFENPLMWRGWKRNVSTIFDANFTTRLPLAAGWHLRTEGYDINKVFIESIANQTRDIVEVNNFIFDLNDNPGGDDFNDFAYIRAYCRITGSDEHLTEYLYYKLENECKNPIAIEWLNSLGGLEMHVFEVSQQVEREAGEGTYFETPIDEDIENVFKTKHRTSGAFTQRLLLTAENLTADQLTALSEIKSTDYVWIWLNKDGSKFYEVVIINDFTTAYDTENRGYTFTVQIELPDNVDFFKAKLY